MLWLIFFLFVAFAFQSQATAQGAVNRTVVIYTTVGDTIIGQGSGVAIGKGYILSVSHLCGKYPTKLLKFIVLYGQKKYESTFIGEDGGQDGLMLLYIPINIPFVKFKRASPLDKVLLYGNTFFLYDIPLVGNIIRTINKTELRNIDTKYIFYNQMMLIDRNIISGFSGSGVWLDSQTLCGIVWGGIKMVDLILGAAVPIGNVISFLKKWGVSDEKEN